MPSTDLVRRDERQVRSYHRAFSGELTIYEFGEDLRLWRPIAARQIFWTVILVVLAWIFGRIFNLPLPTWSLGWLFFYIVLPGLFGWFFSRAVVEGRQLHVVLGAWFSHALYGRHLTGGYQRVSRNRRLGATKIRVEESHDPRSPTPVWFLATGAGVLLLVAVVAIGSSGTAARRIAQEPPRVAALAPILPLAHSQHVPARRGRVVRHAATRHDSSPRRRVAAHARPKRRGVHRTVHHAVVVPAPPVSSPAPPVVAQAAPVSQPVVVVHHATVSHPSSGVTQFTHQAPKPTPDPSPPTFTPLPDPAK